MVNIYIQVQKGIVADPALQAEWSMKKLVWVPHETEGFVAGSIKEDRGDDAVVELVDSGKVIFSIQIQLYINVFQKTGSVHMVMKAFAFPASCFFPVFITCKLFLTICKPFLTKPNLFGSLQQIL